MDDDEFDSDEDEEDEDENEDVNLFREVIVFYSCSDKLINISSLESFGGFEVKSLLPYTVLQMLPIEKAAKKLNKKQEKDRYVNVFISCSTCRYFNLISIFNYYFIFDLQETCRGRTSDQHLRNGEIHPTKWTRN